MKKSIYMVSIFLVLVLPSGQAQCGPESAGQHVEDFYRWYIGEGTNITIDDDSLCKYVDRCALNSLRIIYKRSYVQVDYFTKSQDIAEDWLDVLVIHREIKASSTTNVVPITFKWSEDKQHHLVVFVEKGDAGWRITKVVGTDYFYE